MCIADASYCHVRIAHDDPPSAVDADPIGIHGIGAAAHIVMQIAVAKRANRLIDAEVGEDRGQMLPGGIDAGWEVTPETMAGA
jgi:arylsulfatase